MRELGVFCGTFNPIHLAHLAIAGQACTQFQLERVLVEAACADNPCFEASRLELDREGPSYTVDTLKEVAKLFGSSGSRYRLNLIVGQDNIPYLTQWHNAEQLLLLCRFLVAPRSAALDVALVHKSDLPDHVKVAVINLPVMPISSTMIRERLRQGLPVSDLVHPAVARLLLEKQYYLG